MSIFALMLQPLLPRLWLDLPDPIACSGAGVSYRLIRVPSGIEGEPFTLKLRIRAPGTKSRCITIDDSPGYYEQLTICSRPGGVLIAAASYRNVRFFVVDERFKARALPLVLSSDEGILGVHREGICLLRKKYREDGPPEASLAVLNRRTLRVDRFP